MKWNRDHIILVILVFGLLNSCKKDNNSDTSPDDQLTLSMESKHFQYHFSKSDKDVIDTAWQEKYYKWLLDTLDVQMNYILEYNKYRDREHLKRMTGQNVNGFTEINTYKFQTIWKIENHECVHTVVGHLIGFPPAFFTEGIAVAFQANYYNYPKFVPDWNGSDFNFLSKTYKNNGELPTLDKLLVSGIYRQLNCDLAYPISGSFVSFLIKKYSLERTKDFFKACKYDDSQEKIYSDFNNAYGLTLEDAWNEWQKFIKDY